MGRLLGVVVGAATREQLVATALEVVDRRGGPWLVACANPHSLVAATRDSAFRAALLAADAVIADGVGVTLAGRLTGTDVGPRIAGESFFRGLMDGLEARGGARVFFLGSTEGVLGRIRERVAAEWPRVTIAGTLSPPFGTWPAGVDNELVRAVNDAAPDVLWVGMTAPRQEKWAQANRAALTVPVIGSIGAVFDFLAGTHPRAPRWMCDAGLEWLYRLAREPRRMWRRNFVSTPIFLGLVARDALARRLSRRGRTDTL